MKLIKLVSIVSIISLSACTQTKNTQENYTWSLEVIETQIVDKLETTQEVTQYDGTKISVNQNKNASDNFTFLLINLSIKKQKVGGNSFDWKDVYVQDSNGNQYSRLEDGFLELHNYQRLPQTSFNIGNHEGWIAFEIPRSQIDKLFIIHTYLEGNNELELKIK